MTVKIEREDMSAQELRQLAGRVKDGRVSQRLLAIAMVLEGTSRKVAAESCGKDRQTLRDWVHRYNAEGVKGLSNRRSDGVKPLLTSDQMAQLATWVEDGPAWSEMVSCVGGGWISRVGLRWFSASNFMSAR